MIFFERRGYVTAVWLTADEWEFDPSNEHGPGAPVEVATEDVDTFVMSWLASAEPKGEVKA